MEHGAFSCIWGNNPEHDLAMPEIERDRNKEGMIFERLEEWIWSLEHDKPPAMSEVQPKLALESLARLYGNSQPGLPTIELPAQLEHPLRRRANLQAQTSAPQAAITTMEKEVEAHSVRIAELMKTHEHGILETTHDKLLIDFVTKTSRRTDTEVLKDKYPAVFNDVQKISESRKLKVNVQTA